MEFKVITLNCWGIPVVSKNRRERMQAIAEYLATNQYDVVCLQEIWATKDFNLIRDKVSGVLPYAHYFYSGVVGSGVCILSRHPFQDVFFHQWSVNGYVHKIQHGDWFGGKGVGLCQLKINGFRINVYSAHLHAEYNRENDEYQAHRVLQAYDTAQFIQLTSSAADLVVLAGDLNTEPGDLAYRAFCSGGVDLNDEHNPIDNQEHGFMVFFRDYFASFINNSFVKVLVIAIFAMYLLGAGYGITQIEEGLERRKVAKKDSYAVEFFDREDDYFREFPYRVQVIVSGELDYSNKTIQAQIENLTQTFENTSYISNTLYTESWLRSFVQYADRNQDYLNITTDDEQSFISSLKEYWLTPTSPFSLDVAFNEDKTKIVGMRFLIQAVNISGTEHEKEMVRALRKICHDSSLNASVFHPYFVFFDQFELVRPMSLQNMVLGALVMMVISFLFIPNPLCSLWVAFSIISIETGVVGYMALWKVNLDSISMINLIMCIGFSVDFTAHICYAYMSSTSKHPDDKVRDCLYAVGLPIFQGAVSTILGMVALLLADSYIFSVFFKMVFLVVFCGAMHGLFLLPVLLSVFGPGSCTKKTKELAVNMSNLDKSLPQPYYIPHPQFTLNTASMKTIPSVKTYITAGDEVDKKYVKGYIPNGGLTSNGALDKEKKYNRGYDMEKDLGLGTSEENSSESSSNKSHNLNKTNNTDMTHLDDKNWRRQAEVDEDTSYNNWGPNSGRGYASSQFHASQVLDIYGNSSEEEWYKQRDRIEQNRRRFYETRAQADNRDRFLREQNRHRRRYSPPEQVYHRPMQEFNRSNSYHNLQHARYIQGMRFP